MAKIYTRRGDDGSTGLGNNHRIAKIDPRIEAIGTIDELNASLGLALAQLPSASQLTKPLEAIQHLLFVIGSRLAIPTTGQSINLVSIQNHQVHQLEELIDRWWGQVPDLNQFILPGGSPAAASLHLARVVARRAERTILRLAATDEVVESEILKFMNRLSDLLFAAARLANKEADREDVFWNQKLTDLL